MKSRVNSRGLSPVIATVLLIALVLILILIIFMWSRGFISESIQKGGVSAQEVCSQVKLEIFSEPGAGQVALQIVNRGDIPVYGFEVKTISGGESYQNTYNISVEVGGSATASVPAVGGDKIIIYPVILGTVTGKSLNKAYTCIENGESVN